MSFPRLSIPSSVQPLHHPSNQSRSYRRQFRPGGSSQSGDRGFTLLELVMVMTIIVILAAVGVSSFQQMQVKARETILKQNLNTLRKLLDQYTADREALPQTLEDLVSAGYLREVPLDPMTGEANWYLEMGDDPVSLTGGQGIVNVRSSAQGAGTDGKAYSEY